MVRAGSLRAGRALSVERQRERAVVKRAQVSRQTQRRRISSQITLNTRQVSLYILYCILIAVKKYLRGA